MSRCANIVPPNGGVKDTLAPKLLSVEKNEKHYIYISMKILSLKTLQTFTHHPSRRCACVKNKKQASNYRGRMARKRLLFTSLSPQLLQTTMKTILFLIYS